MNAELERRCNEQLLRYDRINADIRRVQTIVDNAERSLADINSERELIERSLLALKQVRPLLSGSSIKECEDLANSAIKSIFGFSYTVEYDLESNRFVLNKGEYSTDLSEAEGGGIITVISFVFLVYLIVKLNKRRVIFLDEAFTQVLTTSTPSAIIPLPAFISRRLLTWLRLHLSQRLTRTLSTMPLSLLISQRSMRGLRSSSTSASLSATMVRAATSMPSLLMSR